MTVPVPPEAYEAARKVGRLSTSTRDVVDAAAPLIAEAAVKRERVRIAELLRAEAEIWNLPPKEWTKPPATTRMAVLRVAADRLLAEGDE